MFLGEYVHSVDAKGRIAVPAKYREDLADGLVVTRGFDQNLLVYPMSTWQSVAERVNALPLGDPNARSLRRLLFSSATDMELDKQGRILLPAYLRSYAGIEGEAVIAGMNTFFEIWSSERWQTVLERFPEEGSAIAQTMAALGI